MRKILVFILLSCSLFGGAQDYPEVDSLDKYLEQDERWEDSLVGPYLIFVSRLMDKDIDLALKYADRGLELAREKDNLAMEGQLERTVGIVWAEKGYYEKTVKHFLNALRISEELGDTNEVVAMNINMGVVYSRKNNLDKALKYSLRALEVTKESQIDRNMASIYSHIASVYYSKGMLDSAREYSLQARRLALEEEDSVSYNRERFLLGAILIRTGQIDHGKELIESHLKYIRDREEFGDYAGYLSEYGKLLVEETEEYDKALNYCQEGFRLARETGFLYQELEACECIAASYEGLGNAEKALEYYKKSKSIRDTVANQSSESKMEALLIEYDLREQRYQDSVDLENERRLADAELQYRQKLYEDEKNQKFILAGGVLLLLGLVILVFRAYRGKKKANEVISSQKNEIEITRKKTLESINYAERIQRSFLRPPDDLKLYFKDSFVYYKPRDIVSGDYYWFDEVEGKIILACADCTGHGVPGGFLSVVGHVLMNQTIRENKVVDPGRALTLLHEGIKESLGGEGNEEMHEGMDISIVVIDKEKNTLAFSGAGLGIYLARESGVDYLKPSPFSLGGMSLRPGRKIDREYKTQTIPIEDGGWFYMFSDGFVDQFGGPNDEKYNLGRFRENVENFKKYDGLTQKRLFVESLIEWQGSSKQNDDILLIGARV